MGQGASRDRSDNEINIQPGVQITEGLMQQLQGVRPPRQPTKLRNSSVNEAAMLRQNQLLAKALEGSQRIGDMLLKHEAEEMQRISELADEIIEREYKAPSRDPPCGPQAEACLQCYSQHPEDATECAQAADAYIKCARQAWSGIIKP